MRGIIHPALFKMNVIIPIWIVQDLIFGTRIASQLANESYQNFDIETKSCNLRNNEIRIIYSEQSLDVLCST